MTLRFQNLFEHFFLRVQFLQFFIFISSSLYHLGNSTVENVLFFGGGLWGVGVVMTCESKNNHIRTREKFG